MPLPAVARQAAPGKCAERCEAALDWTPSRWPATAGAGGAAVRHHHALRVHASPTAMEGSLVTWREGSTRWACAGCSPTRFRTGGARWRARGGSKKPWASPRKRGAGSAGAGHRRASWAMRHSRGSAKRWRPRAGRLHVALAEAPQDERSHGAPRQLSVARLLGRTALAADPAGARGAPLLAGALAVHFHGRVARPRAALQHAVGGGLRAGAEVRRAARRWARMAVADLFAEAQAAYLRSREAGSPSTCCATWPTGTAWRRRFRAALGRCARAPRRTCWCWTTAAHAAHAGDAGVARGLRAGQPPRGGGDGGWRVALWARRPLSVNPPWWPTRRARPRRPSGPA